MDEKTILPGTIVASGQTVPYLICLFAQLDVLYSDTSSYAILRVEASKATESTGQPPNCVNYHCNHDGPSSRSRHCLLVEEGYLCENIYGNNT